jgi:hypothetical protein
LVAFEGESPAADPAFVSPFPAIDAVPSAAELIIYKHPNLFFLFFILAKNFINHCESIVTFMVCQTGILPLKKRGKFKIILPINKTLPQQAFSAFHPSQSVL